MDKFGRLFKRDKMGSTTFHRQTNGAFECMHYTLTEYIKAYVEQNDHSDGHIPVSMHSYNTTDYQSMGYSPHKLVFGHKARILSRIKLPPKGQTLNEYFKELVETLTGMRTIAAMNQVQVNKEHRRKYENCQSSKPRRQQNLEQKVDYNPLDEY
ncbi:uncharacterized protein LOC106647069 [Copidosoma floridanum]|uniref:uncharacterized protein LOC106647069 n=1 Tax=Copidosoma floridanum TaxID=29053 RepID=UPI0006C95446|nr:uncharacterized protein LOC106647069 [Copidosoma floridanum]